MGQHFNARTTRRTVLAGIAATLAPGTLVAQVQPRGGMRRIGVLMGTNDPEGQARAAALVQGLGVLNWKDGGNLQIDWRWGEADAALFERYAAELVALGPAVILASGDREVRALRQQTSTVPIVFANAVDPVGQGFVASLARPGGTVTGFSSYDPPIAGKWLQMLTQLTPPVARAGVLFNVTTENGAGLLLHAMEQAAPSLGVAVSAAPCRNDAEIEAMMTGLARDERGGVVVLLGPFLVQHAHAIVALAARYRLPAVYPHRFFAAAGGLMSYDSDVIDRFRRAAGYIDRILKGAKPSDLPVQNPIKFDLVLNLKTAKALGVTFPTTLLATADEVIE